MSGKVDWGDVGGSTFAFLWIFGPIIVGLLVVLGVIDSGDPKPLPPGRVYAETCYEAPYGVVEC